MTIRKTETCGYCFGVKKAMDRLYSEIEKNGDSEIYTYGPIIHNPRINRELEARNVKIQEDPEKIPAGAKVFIRTHGISPDVKERFLAKTEYLIDVTCPKVRFIHQIAENSENLIVAGDQNHPEVVGIVGYCRGEVWVVRDLDELAWILPGLEKDHYTFVAQTTFHKKKWSAMKSFILDSSAASRIRICETICNSTSDRQREVEELAKDSDFFIVIGGKNSSNTNKLFEIASHFCETIHIENTEELPDGIPFRYKKIGLSCGASTPAEAVEEVINKMISENEKVFQDDVKDEDIDFAQAMEATIKIIRNGQRVTGTVSAINGTEIQVDLGGKHSGFIPTIEFADDEEPVQIGDTVDALVVKVNDVEGTVLLSKKKIDAAKNFEKIEQAMKNDATIKGKVSEIVKGGLVVNVGGVRVCVPGSWVALRRNVNFEDYANKEVSLKIISTEDGNRRKVVGSIKAVLAAEKEEKAAVLWAEIAEGKKYRGKVISVTTFGAFVDIGGADGLLHISDMSWEKVRKVEDFVKVGDELDVIVKSFDRETKKISLTAKDPENDPWKLLSEKYAVGDIIDVKVLKLMPYGAFVSVIPGIDGLIHISQLANTRVENVSEYFTVDQTVAAKIIDINYETKKVSLSIKAIADEAVAAESEVAGEAAPDAE